MKAKRFSWKVTIPVLAVSVLALWAGAAPVGTSGDFVTGGWQTCNIGSGWNTILIGVEKGGGWGGWCNPCSGTVVKYCSQYYMGCSGGQITVVNYGGTMTPHAVGDSSCYGSSTCDAIKEASCS